MDELMQIVMAHSNADVWEEAVKEWVISNYRTSRHPNNQCICGHCNIVHLYTIENTLNNSVLDPIGSTCIKRFGRPSLDNEIIRLEERLAFLENVQNSGYISLDSRFFTRNILKWLYEEGGLFREGDYGTPEKVYSFALDMFNKRNKSEITEKQRKRISWIILNRVRPFVIRQANERVND